MHTKIFKNYQLFKFYLAGIAKPKIFNI